MRTIGKTARGRAPRALATTLVLTLLAALLLAGAALAAGKPGKPSAKTPKGTVETVKPTFTWSKAKGAARYEVRVYKGKKLQLKKTGLSKRSWTSSMPLPTNVDLTWKVRASNAAGAGAWSRSLTFMIVPPSPEKAITAFSFEGLTPAVIGDITEADHTIALSVPYGTPVTALIPTITITGASVTPASGVATDFTSPVTYTVTAADATTQDYTVTVTVAANPAKAITAFTVPGQTGATVINEADKTIALTVPFGSDVSALVATFTTTGTSVAIAGTPQVSGTTANNFANPVTYTVTAADATTQPYVVTVTVAAAAIGQSYGGGVIAYILQSGDPGYLVGQTHGLIAAAADQTQSDSGIIWALPAFESTLVPGGTGTAIGTGAANTNAIIAQNGAGSTYAAGLARAYTSGVYSDWYLPSQDELNKLYINRMAIGGFESAGYWSSSESDASNAWFQRLDNGAQAATNKNATPRVRAVRAF